jgi:hypothetical protein
VSDSTREILVSICRTLRKQQETLLELSCKTRALTRAVEESNDDASLRYGRYHQVALRSPETQRSREVIKLLDETIRRLEDANARVSYTLAESVGGAF